MHKNRQTLTDVYKVKFRPSTASTCSLISGREIEFNPFPLESINYKSSANLNNPVKLPVKLKHHKSSTEINAKLNKDITFEVDNNLFNTKQTQNKILIQTIKQKKMRLGNRNKRIDGSFISTTFHPSVSHLRSVNSSYIPSADASFRNSKIKEETLKHKSSK